MSEFDKEAEREKLREKYGDEVEDREATQQMSELLLQGATMTNKHCDQCGDPIFRHEGQEFCPTCQVEVGEAAEGSASGGEQAAADADATPERAGSGEADGAGATRAGRPQDGETATRTPPGGTGADAERAVETPDEPQSPDRRPATPDAQRPPETGDRAVAGAGAGGSVADARRSLERTLARFARRAEETDDPRAARDHLGAAREAAEALAALRK